LCPDKPPSQTWRTFLHNQIKYCVAVNFFTIPTVLSHDRRRLVHFNVTHHPTAAWMTQQIAEAFPWDTAPRYLIRDRDSIYGLKFQCRVDVMGTTQVVIAPRSPWQNAYVERVIGSIRRECLDHLIIINKKHLCRILHDYRA
jgi:putative transposase